MEVSVMGVNVPPFFETDHRSSIHPASFILYSNRAAVPEMIPYWQGDGLIIRPVYLLFLPKTVRKFVGMTICAGDGKMLRRTLHIKIQTDQQRIKAAIADNAASRPMPASSSGGRTSSPCRTLGFGAQGQAFTAYSSNSVWENSSQGSR